jgi:hypothetical protein
MVTIYHKYGTEYINPKEFFSITTSEDNNTITITNRYGTTEVIYFEYREDMIIAVDKIVEAAKKEME